MYNDRSVGVIVPAYNEAGFVGEVIRDLPDFVDRVIAIDDCSTDGTWSEILQAATGRRSEERVIAELDQQLILDGSGGSISETEITNRWSPALSERVAKHRSLGRVTALRHVDNRGAGGAIKTGYLAALDFELDITVTVDGDGQMDLSQMSKLLDPIVEETADYAKANRLLYKDYRSQMPKFRFLGNALLTFLTKISSGYWKTMDPQNGYTAISKYALENVGIEDMYEYYGYCNDLLVKLNAKGMRVADVALPAVYGDEQSHISYPSYIWNVSGMLLRNFLWRLKVRYLVLDFHPLAFFYAFGIGLLMVGILGIGWSTYGTLFLGQELFTRGAMSLLLFTLGSLFFMFAMLYDMQVNESNEVQIRE